MQERQPNIVILEGPQGSGKTSATSHLSERGYQKMRGIPTGEELIQNKESVNWKKSCLILAEISSSDGDKSALDRSLISLVAFNMRKRPENAELIYNIGRSMLRRTINGKDYCIVVINSRAEDCINREDKNSVVAIDSLEEAQREIDTYTGLVERLKSDGFNVVSIDNIGVSKEDFFELLTEALGSE